MSIVVEVDVVADCGRELTSVARRVPERIPVPGESAGDGTVDEAVGDFLMSLGQCFVGGATAVHVLGQDAVGAAGGFVEADRVAPVGGAGSVRAV